MEKYQKLFINRIESTVKGWRQKEAVSESDLYRFLHTIKGTAASIGLESISDVATKKLEELDEESDKKWDLQEWELFLEFLRETKIQEVEPKLKEEKIENILDNEKLLLLVDEDITHVNLLKEKFENEGYMVLAALNAEKALTLFYDHKPDCILLNLHLPDQNGFQLLETILEKSHSHFIPIILLSTDSTKATRIDGYAKGAADFIVKPVQFDELLVRVENKIKYKDMVSNAVLIDELTGAFNRKFFKMELNRYLFELDRTNDRLSLVVIDLDHFKKVNDSYGHLVGDIVLKGFSQFILNNKRQSDYLIRYGGEEFILLLPHTLKHDAMSFVTRLLADFSKISFMSDRDEPFSVTFSAGIVEIDNAQIHIEEYVKRADSALYHAKENGRNQVSIYNENARFDKTTSEKIRVAIIDDDAVVHELVKDRLSNISFGNHMLDIESFREGESFFASEWHKQSGKYLILLDGIMPRMDGLEVLRKIRTDYPEKKFVVLMLTGRKGEKDIVRALELGADDYLTKPFSFAELEARVKRLVKRMLI